MYDVPVAVKDTLRDGRLKKNYRFVVLNDDETEDFTIDNDNLVSESVNIDERMCSGDTIKFGLCEGSSLEFQYFGMENIIGRRLQAFIDVNYNDITKSIYSDVKKQYTNIRQSSGGYSWHSSDYTLPSDGVYKVYVSEFLAYFGDVLVTVGGVQRAVSAETFSDGHKECYLGELETGAKVMLRSNSPACTAMLRIKTGETIPMGFFNAKKCSRQASTGIIKATCYNKLQSEYLDAKANDLLDTIYTDTDNNNEISVWAIQKQLLKDYEIKEKDGIPSALVGQSNTLSYIDSAFTFKFNDSNQTYYPIIGWKEKGFRIPSGKKLKISSLNKFINKLQSQQDKLWTDIRQKCQSADAVISNLKKNTLFQMVSGVAVGFYNYSGTVPNPHYELSPILTKVVSNTVTSGRSLITNVYSVADLTKINNQLKVIDKLTDSLYFMDAHDICFFYITRFGGSKSSSVFSDYRYVFDEEDIYFEDDDFENAYYTPTNSEKILLSIEDISDFTLRDLVSANYEMNCQFGQLSRITDLFSGVELNRSRLYPAETLYPSDTLYPGGAAASGFKSMYSQLWADEGNVHKWRYLIITYKGLDGDGNEIDRTLQRTINNDGTDNYNMSDNWLFRNLVWTPEQVGAYADAMVLKMRDITWFPFEMWCAGLPYIETGDEIEIPLGEETYTSYILQRQLKGIQNLQDTYINGTLDIF